MFTQFFFFLLVSIRTSSMSIWVLMLLVSIVSLIYIYEQTTEKMLDTSTSAICSSSSIALESHKNVKHLLIWTNDEETTNANEKIHFIFNCRRAVDVIVVAVIPSINSSNREIERYCCIYDFNVRFKMMGAWLLFKKLTCTTSLR